MVIKKFQAASESEAMMQVKEEMGSEAVIMNIKKTKHKGVMKLFKPIVVEVTAALEEEDDAPILPKKQEGVDLVADEPVKFTMETNIQPEEMPQLQETLQQTAAKNENAIEEKLDNLQSLLEKQMGKEIVDETEEPDEKDENMKFLQLIYNTLLDNEVQEKCIEINKQEETIYNPIWSNESIETWILLHFIKFDIPISRNNCIKKINQNFAQRNLGKYKKNDEDLYDKLSPYLSTAIQNAKWLDSKSENKLPSEMNPCTRVYKLVELLNKYI